MIRYTFKDDGPVAIKGAVGASPQRIGEELAAVAAASNGHLTPSAVVSAARDPSSAMHRLFEWDDAKAAESWRLEKAREIIRIIRIAEDEGDPPVRAFLSIGDRGGVSYRTAQEVSNSRDLQLAVLRQAERDLEAWERRYRDIEDICSLVRVARERVAEKREEMESRA
jgi:hypothetical protein